MRNKRCRNLKNCEKRLMFIIVNKAIYYCQLSVSKTCPFSLIVFVVYPNLYLRAMMVHDSNKNVNNVHGANGQ